MQHFQRCARCERSKHRFGVVATWWPRRPRVLILDSLASREQQALATAGHLGEVPRTLALVHRLAKRLGLSEQDFAADVLCACGLSRQVTGDEVAACSGRLLDNVRAHGAPDVVVIVGKAALDASAAAGMLRGAHWVLVGMDKSIPCLSLHDDEPTQITIEQLAGLLKVRARPLESREVDASLAPRLMGTLGAADGSAHKPLRKKKAPTNTLSQRLPWIRRPKFRLRETHIQSHLQGLALCGPFRPRGPWPFVAIDIDRHTSLQAHLFTATVTRVRTLFPAGLYVRSSDSGGVHAYVKLPTGWRYDDAARVVEAYIALRSTCVADLRVDLEGRSQVLRSIRIEVPRHPVRLPFGAGSYLLDAADLPLEKQVEAFERFARSGDTADFLRANAKVRKALRLGVDAAVNRARLEDYLLRQLVGVPDAPKLAASDPWTPFLSRLSVPVAHIAARGIPAVGMRTRLTEALLAGVVSLGLDQAKVEELMQSWLHLRDHSSEDISRDPAGVEGMLRASIARAFDCRAGVPKQAWALALAWLRSELLNSPLASQQLSVEATLFAVLDKFYSSGHPTVCISHRLLAARVGKNNGAEMVRLLLSAGVVTVVRHAIPKHRSTEYELADLLWLPVHCDRVFGTGQFTL